MAVEYSYTTVQTVGAGDNILFNNGSRCCRKGLITHNDGSGIFRLKGVSGRTIYKVQYKGNIAVSAGGTPGPISIAITQNGETLQNAVGVVTPTVAESFFNVSVSTFIILPCGCCDTITIQNITDGTSIDVINSNIIIDRVA